MGLLEKLWRSKKKEPVIVPGLPEKGCLQLTFRCVVQAGESRFSRMEFPGKAQLSQASQDWPDSPCPGSLNCCVTEFPADLHKLAGAGDRIQKLDKGVMFTPEFSIPRELIKNNVVRPRSPGDDPRMGIAQAWRCAVRNEDTGECFTAWHVRRVDGTYPPFHGIIELMADRKLRDAHKLKDGTPLTITMYSKGGVS
jgi:hypothetical protein